VVDALRNHFFVFVRNLRDISEGKIEFEDGDECDCWHCVQTITIKCQLHISLEFCAGLLANTPRTIVASDFGYYYHQQQKTWRIDQLHNYML
jgi:hypothetical protein